MIFKTLNGDYIPEKELRRKMQNAINKDDATEYIRLSKIHFEYFGIINDVRDVR